MARLAKRHNRFARKKPSRLIPGGRRREETDEERKIHDVGDELGQGRRPRLEVVLGRGVEMARGIRVALDFRHPSWEGVSLDERSVAVDGVERPAPFRYLRFRDPPYDEQALAAAAERVRILLADGDVYCFFRHEDEPTAPAYAARLRELVGA